MPRPLSEVPLYSQDETISAIRSFYKFLTKLYMPDSYVVEPPPGGWDHMTDEDLAPLGKSKEVMALLRHLPYIIEPGFESLDCIPVGPNLFMADWRMYANHYHKCGDKTDMKEKLLTRTEGPFSKYLPGPHVVGLTTLARPFDVDYSTLFFLDTTYGIVHFVGYFDLQAGDLNHHEDTMIDMHSLVRKDGDPGIPDISFAEEYRRLEQGEDPEGYTRDQMDPARLTIEELMRAPAWSVQDMFGPGGVLQTEFLTFRFLVNPLPTFDPKVPPYRPRQTRIFEIESFDCMMHFFEEEYRCRAEAGPEDDPGPVQLLPRVLRIVKTHGFSKLLEDDGSVQFNKEQCWAEVRALLEDDRRLYPWRQYEDWWTCRAASGTDEKQRLTELWRMAARKRQAGTTVHGYTPM